MSHVVLVAPPNPSMLEPRIAPPLGLLFLASWLTERAAVGCSVEVIDLNVACYEPTNPRGHATHDFSLDRCLREIPGGAAVYGISLASMQMPHGIALCHALRKRDPDALLVAGGSHASSVPHEVAEVFDVVVQQEGEVAFSRIVAGWLGGGADAVPFRAAHARMRSGVADARGLVVDGVKIDPLDRLPFPARHLLDFTKYVRKVAGQAATNIITTRGCPARCNFCQQTSLWGDGALRVQTAPRILAEVDAIYEQTGIRNLLFLDDSLTARKRSDMFALCDGLRERGVKWRGWTRANLVARPGEEEVLAAMADAGCQALCVGVEAGTDRVLRGVGKGTTVAQNRTAIARIKAAGMYARSSIMVGNPGETWDDVIALVDFIAEVEPDDWILSSYVPLPGTPAWDTPEKYGMIIDKEKAKRDAYRHFFVVGGDEQSGLVHRYVDGTGPEEIQARHDFVQESLLRLAPRDRIRVTIGRGVDPSERRAH